MAKKKEKDIEVRIIPTEVRNEVIITHANASVTIKSNHPLPDCIKEAERMISKVKVKPALGHEYG